MNYSLKFNYTISEINNIEKEIIKTDEAWLSKVRNELCQSKTHDLYLDPESFLESYLFRLSKFDYTFNIINFLQYVSPKKDIRDASRTFELNIKTHFMNFFKSVENYKLFLILKKIKIKKDDVNNKKKLIKKILKSFEDNGVHLKNDKKILFDKINKKLLLLENNFSKNIANGTTFIKYKKEELKGVEPGFLKSHKKNNLYIVDTSYPDEQMIMRNCIVEKSRKRMYYAFHNIAKNKNLGILEKIINYRTEISHILNFKNTVNHYLSHDRIATVNKINQLLDKLIPIAKKCSDSEYKLLLNYSNRNEIYDYDMQFYMNQYKKEYLNLDNELIKKYFPSNYTIPKIFEQYSSLFGIKIVEEKIEKNKIWHKDVQLYKVLNKEDNRLIGYIYLDLYPRLGKFTHAATFELQTTYRDINNERVIPSTAIVCNFNPREKGKSYAFFNFSEITTFCHELGHGLHNILSNVKYEYLAGISNEEDFVEMPSQLFENWCWNKKFLKSISYNQKLPDEIIDSIIKNRYFFIGTQTLTQILYLKYDLTVHSKQNINEQYLHNEWFKIANQLLPFKSSSDVFPMCRFDHLIGYQCGYYSYMWSLIYAYDIFSLFEKNGFLNKNIGMKFRKEILEKGSTLDGIIIIKNFLKRNPTDKSFLQIFK